MEGIELVPRDVLVRAEDLSVSFATGGGLFGKPSYLPAVEDCTLEVGRREVVSLVGESGCGKTTFGKATIGLIRPTGGRVLFEGKDIWKLKGRDYREFRINSQIIHQDPYASLHPGKRVSGIVGEGIAYHKMVSGSSQINGKVTELLNLVGLTPPEYFLDKFPHQLSGGQRQRVAIARAIGLNPRYIVADEVVTMIDVSLKIGILDLLLNLRSRLGTSFLFITHDFAIARYFASEGRIAVMYLGNIVEVGPTEDLVSNPLHPYTKALLSAVPVPDPRLARERKMLELRRIDPPNPMNPPPGCKFSDRCPDAISGLCDARKPELVEARPNHLLACHSYARA